MSTPFADAAATWDRRYQGDDYHFGRRPNAWLQREAVRLRPGSQVLSVADGEGRNSVWLASQGHRVSAFDVSSVGLAKARALAAQAGVAVDFTQADVDGYAWPVGTLDAVVAIFVQFADPALRQRLFARMAAALRPGGLLLLQGYTPQQLVHKTGGPPIAAHLYTPELLRGAFAGLEILALDDYEDTLDEGSGHAGRSALIGLVARRPD